MKNTPPDYVKKYLQVAESTIVEAEMLLDGGQLRGAINRIYYASFYAVSALLEAEHFNSKKHSGVRSIFNKEFIQTGKLELKHAAFFNSIFDLRNDVDYLMDAVLDFTKVKVSLENAKSLLEAIKAYIYS